MPEPPSFDRLLWKAADRIRDRLHPRKPSLSDQLFPDAPLHQWQVCLRRIRKANDRKWSSALENIRHEALVALAEIGDWIVGCRGVLNPRIERPGVSSVGDIYRDLVSLRDEFPNVAVDFSDSSVSVTTESIILEDVYLGPFEIKLSWSDASTPLSYEVSACDPHPATSSDIVTHPHVESDRLCEGDGSPLIRQALQQGRLADFFLIVRQILETYNSGSAYVQLDQWSGRDCPDCGYSMTEDEMIGCSHCETDLCGECTRDCRGCGSSFCGECLSICSQCSESICNSCVSTCSGCDESVCESCLEICSNCNSTRCEDCLDEGLCSDCCSKKDETDPPQASTEAAVPDAAVPDAAIQSVCVGEAVVPA
jgi:hypothetical protein